jgi:hypothetical protein
MGLEGLREGLGRGRPQRESEPTARCVPAVPRARLTGPEESDILLWTQSGGLTAPTSPRCWSKENNLKKVSLSPLPPPALFTHPQPAAPPRTRPSHMLLRAAQIAILTLHGAREHVAHPLAQLWLFYFITRRAAGPVAGAGALWRVGRVRSVFV